MSRRLATDNPPRVFRTLLPSGPAGPAGRSPSHRARCPRQRLHPGGDRTVGHNVRAVDDVPSRARDAISAAPRAAPPATSAPGHADIAGTTWGRPRPSGPDLARAPAVSCPAGRRAVNEPYRAVENVPERISSRHSRCYFPQSMEKAIVSAREDPGADVAEPLEPRVLRDERRAARATATPSQQPAATVEDDQYSIIPPRSGCVQYS